MADKYKVTKGNYPWWGVVQVGYKIVVGRVIGQHHAAVLVFALNTLANGGTLISLSPEASKALDGMPDNPSEKMVVFLFPENEGSRWSRYEGPTDEI